jgi:hypothetical protein
MQPRTIPELVELLFDWDGNGRTRVPGVCLLEWMRSSEWDEVDAMLHDFETKGGE